MRTSNAAIVVAVWIAPFTALLSILSSGAIVYMMLSDFDKKIRDQSCSNPHTRQQPRNRFLLAMGLVDILASLGVLFSALPMPKESQLYGAFGNQTTCVIQGFLIELGMTVIPCYNACQCIWFLKSIKYNMTARDFRAKIEPYCHAVALLIPLGLMIATSALGMYGPSFGNTMCGGLSASESESSDDRKPTILIGSLRALILCLSFIIIVSCMTAIYCSFRHQERTMRRYSTSASGMQWRPTMTLEETKEVAIQGLLFSLAFILSFLFPTLNGSLFGGDPSFLLIPQSIFTPLQGFWNFVIYTSRSVRRIRLDYTDLWLYQVVWKLVFHPNEVAPRPMRRRGNRRTQSRFSVIRRDEAPSNNDDVIGPTGNQDKCGDEEEAQMDLEQTQSQVAIDIQTARLEMTEGGISKADSDSNENMSHASSSEIFLETRINS